MKQTHSLTQVREIISDYGSVGELWLRKHPRKISVRALMLFGVLRNMDENKLRKADIKRAEIQALSIKLMHLYPQFQQWVLIHFVNCLIRATARQGVRELFAAPLNALDLSERSIALLNKLDILTLNDIDQRYNNTELLENPRFRIITDFIAEQSEKPASAFETPLLSLYQQN